MTSSNIIVCCRNVSTNEKNYVEMNRADVQAWIENNPQYSVDFIFCEKSDISPQISSLKIAAATSNLYSIPPSYLNTNLIDYKSHTVRLVGMKPRNPKYKCIIHDLTDDRVYKVTPEYVRRCQIAP